MIHPRLFSIPKAKHKINAKYAYIRGRQGSKRAFVSGRASVFSHWLRSVISLCHTVESRLKRMNANVTGKRNEREGWVSLRIRT